MEQIALYEVLPDQEAKKYRPKKSTDWKWSFSDYPKKTNGLKVFSCFSCGGGSTMGYKLSGCDVIGNCEIDAKMNEVYLKNHNPKYNFLMDIRDFNNLPNEDIPEELFNLDILDGSPPCTTFSMAGDREESWGKKKKFREGQAEQTLDDLSFVFIETAKKLHPKVVILENVEGLLIGAAWVYVQKIYKKFREAGYKVNHWLLRAETLGVPQKRHRCFFVGVRSDLMIDPMSLDMSFDYEPVTFGMIKWKTGYPLSDGKIKTLAMNIQHGDLDLSGASGRLYGKPNSFFNYMILYDEKVCYTIPAKKLFD